ncbi:Na/Pi cotransporter family protein [Rhizobium sp. NRK18]|uniref:Na/Pi cotransporter family protein n=1 Tax=Rhizobium sp. NRK18 TaxID=2964667 RepID=UPI0021C421B5|nr:Na/Pi cotransporter family protein [Rhizobium sp. NRK18]MCQ2006303.1 Na/Pi cotransporter family protein [Rhizobium sp. NRK18]
MESTIVMINLFGAVALLLFGLSQVKEGVTLAFGARLRTVLASGTSTDIRSFLSGFLATIGLQSSTATALMISSFVERGLVRQRMAQVVLLGANVGTAVTAWIVAAGVEMISPLLLLIGLILYRGGHHSRQGAGKAVIGIGLMLLSLHLLSNATEPMRASPALGAFIGLLDNAWPVALAFSAAIAFVSSSSLAAVVLILSLASTGHLSPELTIVLVLGANLGGAVPPVLASLGTSASGKRVTIANLIVRAVGCVIALPMVGYAAEAFGRLPYAATSLPVDVHLSFNIALALLAWPLTGMVAGLTERLVPDEAVPATGPRYLDQQELATPVVALASATREVLGIGDLVERMLLDVSHAFEQNDMACLTSVASFEKQVDALQGDVKLYLSKLARNSLDEEDSRRSIQIIDYAINLEHVGDIVEKGLLPQVAKKISLGLTFSEEGYDELRRLFDLTIDNLRIAQSIFVTGDIDLARQMMELKVEVRRMEKDSAERHLRRLRDGLNSSLQTSSLHLDILRDLKRVNAHLVSVAHPILDERGHLVESRLRIPAQ